jgi:NAD(P)-dependent dehydrogenase (short-subunit alcohol dehydrogenase family)
MSGKVVLITGANSGIGKIAAQEIAKMGAQVVMLCRDKERGEAARQEVIKFSGNDKVELLLVDLSSQKSIREGAEEFLKTHDKLHVLINNAGAANGKPAKTVDGIELTFAVNHLGYFLLTNLLLNVIKKSEPARIVSVSSEGQKSGKIHWDDINFDKKYNDLDVYCQSKLANIMFSNELSRKLQGTNVTSNSLHPGVVKTQFGMNTGGTIGFMAKAIRPFEISPEKGAITTVYLATSPEVEGVTGKYFAKCKSKSFNQIAQDEKACQQLWELSVKMTNLE